MSLAAVLSEFRGLSNNEAYLHAFNQRVLLPSEDPVDPFLGNTQRVMFLPFLNQIVAGLGIGAKVLDIGAGKGEIVDLSLESHAPAGTTVSIEEPNPILFQAYQQRLQRSPSLRLGQSWNEPVQDLYQRNLADHYDLILSIHMIYHLTDWQDFNQDPVKHLEEMVAFAYSLLKPGGRLFLVYADQEHAMSGRAGLYYYRTRGDRRLEKNLVRLYRARNQLFAEGGISLALTRLFPNSTPTVTSHLLASCFYGRKRADLAAMALVGEMISADNQPFDTEKLVACAEYFELQGHEVGLTREESAGPRQGMWRANQPQIATIIQRDT